MLLLLTFFTLNVSIVAAVAVVAVLAVVVVVNVVVNVVVIVVVEQNENIFFINLKQNYDILIQIK